MDFLLNNSALVIVALIIVIMANFFYLKNVDKKIKGGQSNVVVTIAISLSFVSNLYIAIFLGLNTGKIWTSFFGSTLGL